MPAETRRLNNRWQVDNFPKDVLALGRQEIQGNEEYPVFQHKVDALTGRVLDKASFVVESDHALSCHQISNADDGAVHLRVLNGEIIDFTVGLLVLDVHLALVGDQRTIRGLVTDSHLLCFTGVNNMIRELSAAVRDIRLTAGVNHGPFASGHFLWGQH